MKFRERIDQPQTSQNPPDGEPAGDVLEQLRRLSHELLAAGDLAIQRALSGESEKFLEANRQQGGQ